jgi:hypothetical protein
MKYSVIISVDASVHVEVEADNEEQAKDLAMEKAGAPCLCHQCSSELDVGDLIEVVEVTPKEQP